MAAALKILVSGTGHSGSWQIRAVQLGRAIGATVIANAMDVADFDLAILVKRPRTDVIERLRACDVPIAYDVVDAWPQPAANEWGSGQCKAWLRERIDWMAPRLVIAATKQMAEDASSCGLPILTLPHHARPGLMRNPIREAVLNVGYEGGLNNLGGWHEMLEAECADRGWTFRVNPQKLADLDIVVGLRGHMGYAARSWKSNVKLANAQGSGTPCIMSRESGYQETASGAERWADTAEELRTCFDELTPHSARVDASEKLFAAAPKLKNVAKTYREWLESNF